MNSEIKSPPVFVSTQVRSAEHDAIVDLRIGTPVLDESRKSWVTHLVSNPQISGFDFKIIGSSQFHCVYLAFRYIRKFLEENRDVSLYPEEKELYLELPEHLDYGFGEAHYNEQAEAIKKIQTDFQEDLTRRRLKKFPESGEAEDRSDD